MLRDAAHGVVRGVPEGRRPATRASSLARWAGCSQVGRGRATCACLTCRAGQQQGNVRLYANALQPHVISLLTDELHQVRLPAPTVACWAPGKTRAPVYTSALQPHAAHLAAHKRAARRGIACWAPGRDCRGQSGTVTLPRCRGGSDGLTRAVTRAACGVSLRPSPPCRRSSGPARARRSTSCPAACRRVAPTCHAPCARPELTVAQSTSTCEPPRLVPSERTSLMRRRKVFPGSQAELSLVRHLCECLIIFGAAPLPPHYNPHASDLLAAERRAAAAEQQQQEAGGEGGADGVDGAEGGGRASLARRGSIVRQRWAPCSRCSSRSLHGWRRPVCAAAWAAAACALFVQTQRCFGLVAVLPRTKACIGPRRVPALTRPQRVLRVLAALGPSPQVRAEPQPGTARQHRQPRRPE